MGADTPSSPPIDTQLVDTPYLLAVNVGMIGTPDGRLHADRLWARDLNRHLGYLPQFTLLTSVERRAAAPDDYVPLELHGARVVAYPSSRTFVAWLIKVLRVLPLLWREIGRARVVHTGLAGRPVPIGWLAVPIARLRRRRVIVIIESAFWRVPHGQTVSLPRRAKAKAWEAVNRVMMRHVDHAFYSHDQYRASLPAPQALSSTLFRASWVDRATVVSREAVDERWRLRDASRSAPRFAFAARMVEAKGISVMAAAIDRLAERLTAVEIDIVGAGPQLAQLEAKAATPWGRRHLRFLAPVPYGPGFFELLSGYDAVLVPSLSDEQPRIVYDAYAAGVAVIGSDMPGLRECVAAEQTGRLVPTGDGKALADAIVAVAKDRTLARDWGLAGLALAAANTHDRMHDDRAAVLSPFYPGGQP